MKNLILIKQSIVTAAAALQAAFDGLIKNNTDLEVATAEKERLLASDSLGDVDQLALAASQLDFKITILKRRSETLPDTVTSALDALATLTAECGAAVEAAALDHLKDNLSTLGRKFTDALDKIGLTALAAELLTSTERALAFATATPNQGINILSNLDSAAERLSSAIVSGLAYPSKFEEPISTILTSAAELRRDCSVGPAAALPPAASVLDHPSLLPLLNIHNQARALSVNGYDRVMGRDTSNTARTIADALAAASEAITLAGSMENAKNDTRDATAA